MGRTITGELRELLADINWTEIIDHMRLNCGSIVDGDWLDSWHAAADHACDAIDAVHANLERENASLKAELDRVLGEQEDRDGWVELPKDADGEVWHVGDFVVGEINPRNPKAIERMVWYGPDSGWQLETNTIIYPCPDRPRHHHAPTVEDVLREFGRGWHEQMNGPETFDVADYVERYAAKLRRLAGDAS